MTHPEMDELYELYILGVLEPEQAAEIDEHLGDQCEHCLARLKDAQAVSSAMGALVNLQQPPSGLRERVLGVTRPVKRARGWVYAVAGLSAACLALVAYSLSAANSLQATISPSRITSSGSPARPSGSSGNDSVISSRVREKILTSPPEE